MSEAPEFLGIVFRSQSHLGWFQFSMAVFGIGMITFGMVLLGCNSIRSMTRGFFPFMRIFHFTASILAVFMTRFGTMNGPIYSVNCIWFNFLMGTIYCTLYWIAGLRNA